MRGLLYKQLITFRLPAAAIALSHLYFAFFSTASVLDSRGGRQNMWAVLGMIMPFVMFSVCNGELFRCDERDKWCCFAASTPQSSKGQVLVKYYFTLAAHVVILFLCFIVDCIFIAVRGDVAATNMTIGYIFFCVSLMMNAMEFPFYFRFGSNHGGQVKTASIITVVLLLCIYGLFGDISFLLNGNFDDILKALFSESAALWSLALLPAAAMLLFFLSYKISLCMYRKGMENYEQ